MPDEIPIPLALLAEEAEAWRLYGEAVHRGMSRARRRALFARALKATEACLAVIREHREAQAASAAKAAKAA